MPPLNTDYFIKGARKLTTNLDSSGISDAVITNFGLTSVAGLPTDTPCVITVDRVDSNGNKTPAKEEGILGIVSGGSIVSAIRGFEGTAQAHGAGAVVEVRLLAKQWEKLIDGLLVAHLQTGEHKIDKIDGIRYAADAGGDDAYEVTLSPAPAAYYIGMEVNFKPTTANTGACTLNVNGLGAKTIKKNVSSDLSTGDIVAGQMAKVMYDGTNFQLMNLPNPTFVAPRTTTEASSATPTINTDNTDIHTITALATAITSFTTNLSGTPFNGQKLMIRIKDNGTARTIAWGASFASCIATLPTTTVLSKHLYVGFIWNSTTSKWECLAAGSEI